MDDADGLFHIRGSCTALAGNLLQRRRQVAVLVQVADDFFGRIADGFTHGDQRQLRTQMIGEGDGGGKEGFKRRFFDVLRSGALEARIQVVIEIIAEVDFIERIGRGLRDFRRFAAVGGVAIRWRGPDLRRTFGRQTSNSARIGAFPLGRAGGRFQNRLVRWLAGTLSIGFEQRLQLFRRELLGAVGGLFQHRVLGDLGRDHVLQLQAIQLEEAYHLHQAWRQRLLLLNPYLQAEETANSWLVPVYHRRGGCCAQLG